MKKIIVLTAAILMAYIVQAQARRTEVQDAHDKYANTIDSVYIKKQLSRKKQTIPAKTNQIDSVKPPAIINKRIKN